MQRKLIQLSPSTAVVSLPASWIKKNKLTKGKSISLEEQENNLIISASSKKTEKDITVNVKEFSDKLIWRYFDALYIAGYDNIMLLTRDSKQSALIGTIIKYFPGLIIEEERKNVVRILDIADVPSESFDKMLTRIFHITITILEDSIEAIKSKDFDALNAMKKRDYHINSYASYCLRQLNKFGYTIQSKTSILHTYIKLLEMMADNICLYLSSISLSKTNKIKEILAISGLYKQTFSLHYNYNEKTLFSIALDSDNILNSKDIYLSTIAKLFFDMLETEMQLRV